MTNSKKTKFWLRLQVTLCALVITFISAPVSAISSAMLDFFNENGIYYYNPDGIDDCIIGLGSYSGSTSAGLSETQAVFIDTYHDIAQQLSVEYGIPWEAVMAQGILESAAGTSSFAINRNNFFGIGAYDSNPDNAFSYPTPEAGWRGYYENIRKTPTYRNHGVFTGDNITNPYTYIATIKAAGYATAPHYVNSLTPIIKAIENRAKEKGWLSSAELAMRYPIMLENANKLASSSSGNAPSSNMSYTSSNCIVQSGGGGSNDIISQGNGSINETALNLSWPDSNHNKYDPNPAYKQALASTGIAQLGGVVGAGASCDAFVATVMRYSGADPNFPCCGVGDRNSSYPGHQAAYLFKHPELYEYIGVANNSTKAQPGDIRVKENTHIEIVVRLNNGQLAIASASYNDRTADHAISYYVNSSFHIFRRK